MLVMVPSKRHAGYGWGVCERRARCVQCTRSICPSQESSWVFWTPPCPSIYNGSMIAQNWQYLSRQWGMFDLTRLSHKEIWTNWRPAIPLHEHKLLEGAMTMAKGIYPSIYGVWTCKHIKAKIKWLPFCRHLYIYFLVKKLFYFIKISLKIVPLVQINN